MKEKVKGNGLLKIIVALIILLVVIIVGMAFARYVTSLKGHTEAEIAQWKFDYRILETKQEEEVVNFGITRTDNNTEVQDKMLAPGTSGQFILEIDATGTETFLIYDMKLTFLNKPTNLKFYTNSEKTQELVVENDKYLTFYGFMSLDDVKAPKRMNVYWEWPLETGTTDEEKFENDLEDTRFMNSTMSMNIDVKGTQVTSNPYADGVASTTINGKITVYDTVQEAINAAGENQGAIVTLIKENIDENVEVTAGQNIIIDTAGKTLISETETTITNNGTLSITGSGTISGNTATIVSNGVMNINSGNIKAKGPMSDSTIAIKNTGTLNISKLAHIESNGEAINTEGVANITGGTIFGEKYGIVNNSLGKVNIFGDTYISTNGTNAIRNSVSTTEDALVTIIGGTIENTKSSGISSTGKGKFIIGTNDNLVNTKSPVIIGGKYGAESCEFEFYDGILKGKTGVISLGATVTNIPKGYKLVDETEGDYQITYLVKD